MELGLKQKWSFGEEKRKIKQRKFGLFFFFPILFSAITFWKENSLEFKIVFISKYYFAYLC